jgi:hypothetical protein
MKCQRCGINEDGYLCSVCNRVVCSDCKVVNNGKVFCLDHTQGVTQVKPKDSLKGLKKSIYGIVIILIGVILIFFITNFYISKIQIPTDVLPQLSFIMVLLSYFESFGLYSIIGLTLILIILIIVFIIKRRKQ